MNEKNTSALLDEALANVKPERRRFLGMMLAGAAVLPLLTSTELATAACAEMNGAGTTTPAPTFSPASGTVNAGSVKISDAQAGVTIYYTTDGSTPTTSSTKYAGPVNVGNTTVKAVAVANGVSSPVATASYSLYSGSGHYTK